MPKRKQRDEYGLTPSQRKFADLHRLYRERDDKTNADAYLESFPTNSLMTARVNACTTGPNGEFPFVYNPAGAPVLRNGAASQQLGHFRRDGNVETNATPFANSVTTLAELVVLNYLALHGQEALLGMVLESPGIGTGATVEPYIAFEAIA